MNIGKLTRAGILISLMQAIAVNGFALDIIPSNSNYYYQLGGGSDISMPPVTNQQDITIGGGVHTNLGYTCGFNPSVSISNTINDISSSVQGIKQGVIGSATSAVGSMPMYLLSKSNKDLYNLIENTMTAASNTFNLSEKSCTDALNQIKDGKSPYQDWFSISDSQGWLEHAKAAKTGQDVDVNEAKKTITQDPKKYGVPWVHANENSGGTTGDQVPIKVIYDVVVAGYNTMVDPNGALDDKHTVAGDGSGLARYWKSADDAGQWAKIVLGDITISSKEGDDQTSRGIGLMTLVQKCPDSVPNQLTCAKTIAANLTNIVNSNGYPSGQALSSVSSNEMVPTPSLIEGIRNKDKQDQVIAISKWSQDVALQNAVDEALLLRRILIAGSQTKPVHNLKPALTTIQRVISQLNKDIQNILFQFQVRKELMTNTAQTIIGDQQLSEARAVGENSQTQRPSLVNGAVYKKN